MNKQIAQGVVHKVPDDLRKILTSQKKVLDKWNALTPLGRNEWICWVENAKQLETRNHRIERVYTELLEGMRRPCCWVGCIHRKDKPMSSSQRYVTSKQNKTKKK